MSEEKQEESKKEKGSGKKENEEALCAMIPRLRSLMNNAQIDADPLLETVLSSQTACRT